MYEVVAKQVIGLSEDTNVGLVVGATFPQELASLRSSFPDTPFLIPGVGAQGGDATETARLGGDKHPHQLISRHHLCFPIRFGL